MKGRGRKLSKIYGIYVVGGGNGWTGKFAIPPKTIAAVTPDKGAINFKIFVTDEDGMKSFVSGQNALMKPIHDECIESTQLWDLSEVSL